MDLQKLLKENPEQFELLINSQFMNQELFNKQDNCDRTCLHLICIHHPEYLELLINSQFMNQELFNKQTEYGWTCLHLICTSHPEYLELLINSQFMNQELFDKHNYYSRTCLYFICRHHPEYIYNIINCKYFNKNLPNIINKDNKKPFDYLNKIPKSLLPLINNNDETIKIISCCNKINNCIFNYYIRNKLNII